MLSSRTMHSKPIFQRHKRLARTALYGIPLVLLGGALWFIQNAEMAPINLDWVDADFSRFESVRLFQDYLRIDSSYPDGNEIPAAEFLARQLEAEGIKTHLERLGSRNANLWARIEGQDPRALVLHNHIDVEPIRTPKAWVEPPFGAVIRGPFIYGRGAFDMKSVAIAQLMAMLDIQRSGKTPSRSLVFLATGDEERDSWLGTRRLLQQHPEWAQEFWAVLTEGGAVEAVNIEDIKYWGTEFQQKRFVDIWVCDGNRQRLKDLRRELDKKSLPLRIAPDIADFFRHYAPSRQMLEPNRLLREPELMLARLRSYPVDVDATIVPENVDYMMRSNVVAFPIEKDPEGGFKMRVILHMLPDATLEGLWEPLLGDSLDGFTYLIEEIHPPVPASPIDHPVMLAIDEHLAERFPDVDHGPLFVPYSATDARFFRAVGVPSFGFSPFRPISADAMSMKGANEKMPVPVFIEGVEVFQEVIRKLTLVP